MSKGFVFFVLMIFCTAGCKNRGVRRIFRSTVAQAAVMTSSEEIPTRDYSITAQNAYNDLFLDSTAFEKWISTHAVNDSISENMRDFYNVRNFEFAWFDSKGLTEQALGFRSLYKYSTDSVNRKLDKKLDELLMRENAVRANDSTIIDIEFQLTKRFVEFSLTSFRETEMDHKHLETFVPLKKQPILSLADSVLADKRQNSRIYASFNPYYNRLKEQLARYRIIYSKGGWDSVPETKTKYWLGNEYPEIIAVKNRLAASGELAINDSTGIFTDSLQAAIKKYQRTQGMTADGKINTVLIRNLNIPVLKRIGQLLINMERMRWMPLKKEGKLILVNIPEFMLHVSEGDKHVMHIAVVVGKEGHNTTLFADDLTQIVFSPYWNIPPSIVKQEIMPAMQKNPHYLEKNNMEIVKQSGGIPEIRQLPGNKNSLGLVKFLFPNSFNIYFHDTPAKSLFEKDNRAASHGCIRLAEPVKMARYLLENTPEWTPEKIEAAMNGGVEKWVVLKHSVPVIITYYTAWVDENNELNFRDDIYKNDAAFAAKMFTDAY